MCAESTGTSSGEYLLLHAAAPWGGTGTDTAFQRLRPSMRGEKEGAGGGGRGVGGGRGSERGRGPPARSGAEDSGEEV